MPSLHCAFCGKEIANLEKEEFTYFHGEIIHLSCYKKLKQLINFKKESVYLEIPETLGKKCYICGNPATIMVKLEDREYYYCEKCWNHPLTED